MTFRQTLRAIYPFSIYGTLVFLGGLYLAAEGIGLGNLYEMFIAIFMLLLLTCGIIGSLLKRSSFRMADIEVNRKDHLTVGAQDNVIVFRCLQWPFGLFFRLHICLTGFLERGDQRIYRFRKEVRLDQSGPGSLLLTPPLSGVLHLRIGFVLRDCLGLTGFVLQQEQSRRILVHPHRSDLSPENLASAVENQDDQSPAKPLEHEKVFNREYIPGDRFRDLNWKAAGRVQTLLTRIPPDVQGSSRQIEILIQNLVPDEKQDLRRLYYEECLKSLVFSFLENFRLRYPDWSCHIVYNREEFTLADEESLTRLQQVLCEKGGECLGLEDLPLPPQKGSCFLFSTCLNRHFRAYLTRFDRNNIQSYLIQPFDPLRKGGEDGPDWHFRILKGGGDFFPYASSLRLRRKKERPLSSLSFALKEYTLQAVWL